MKRISLILAVAALASCELLTGPAPKPAAKVDPSALKVSGSLITVPSSLTGTAGSLGALGSTRTEASDLLVKASVSSYYSYARNQVEIGAQVADYLKQLIQNLEAVKIGTRPLIGLDFNYDGVANDPAKVDPVKWTSLGDHAYTLEVFRRKGDGVEKSAHLDLKYRLEGETTQVSGSLTVNVALSEWDPPQEGEKHPDWIRAAFDSSREGKTWMKLEVQGYRSFKDLGSTALQNTILELTRDSLGTVSATSSSVVPHSRHFVWNGYLDANPGETLNTAAPGETRYYIFRGLASGENKSTVSLAMAKENYDPSTVFADYSIGKVLAQLFRDRLVNNYLFNVEDADSTGNKVMDTLNSINKTSDPVGPQLSYAPGAQSTPAEVAASLGAVQTTDFYKNSPLMNEGSRTVIEYLDSVMKVSNPAYFDSLVFQSYGASTPAGFPAPADVEKLTPVAKAAVDDLSLGF